MNVFLWILQGLLAVHTLIGALWKFSAEQILPFENPIPGSVWILLSVLEIVCSVGLVIPLFKKSLGFLVPVSALVIAAEMLLFTFLLINASYADKGPMIYWLVVAVICGGLAFARLKLKPIVS